MFVSSMCVFIFVFCFIHIGLFMCVCIYIHTYTNVNKQIYLYIINMYVCMYVCITCSFALFAFCAHCTVFYDTLLLSEAVGLQVKFARLPLSNFDN